MRALQLIGDRKLELVEVPPPPPPAAGEVQVRIKTVALNHLDVWGFRGMAFAKRKLPLVVGAEASAEVAAVGPGVDKFKTGDKVKLMGFDAGEITGIKPMAPDSEEYFDRRFVYVEFVIRSHSVGYIWNDSRVRVNAGDLLGGRYLEILPGGWNGYTNLDGSKKNLRAAYEIKGKLITAKWEDQSAAYTNWGTGSTPYYIVADESLALTKRAEKLVTQIETALPNILGLTNQVSALLAASTRTLTTLDARAAELQPVVSNANFLVASFHPVSSNIHRISANLTNPAGSLGTWLLPTNLSTSAEQTLLSVRATLAEARTTFSNANSTLIDTRRLMQTADGTLVAELAGVEFYVAGSGADSPA